jgi:DNA-binding LacI/PurR family transcriptional regulator/DNA-binding transcriptional regulator YhcF (GntR family)
MKPSLFQNVAARLRIKLAEDAAYRPGAINDLCHEFGVSRSTMIKAVRLLELSGTLESFRGRKIMRPDAAGKAGEISNAVRTLAATIRTAIAEGELRIGDRLPKFDAFRISHRVAKATVSQAVRLLSAENRMHKRGKYWIIGPAARSSRKPVASASDHQPVLLFFMRNEYDWTVFFNDAFTMPFSQAFRSEVERFGTRIKLVIYDSGTEAVPHSLEQVRAFIKLWDDRYRGAILSYTWPRQLPLRQWLAALSDKGRKPVIYFDSVNKAAEFSRDTLCIPRFYRMFFDETVAARRVLEHLYNLGHRIIGFPTFGPARHAWALGRLALLRRQAENFPGCRIETSHLSEPFWDRMRADSGFFRIWYLIRRIREYVSSRRSSSLAHTPSIKSLIDAGATALIAMNDRVGMQYLWWASAAGVRIPRDLSIIGLDNIPESEMIGLTSVDCGFSRLGYLAAHVLIGDFEIKAQRNGDLPSLCSVVVRESTGKRG